MGVVLERPRGKGIGTEKKRDPDRGIGTQREGDRDPEGGQQKVGRWMGTEAQGERHSNIGR